MRPSVPRMTKIIWDDFAPRFEYPESMKKLEEYCKKSGSDYGKYVEKNPDEPRPKKEEVKTRICRKCGKEFEVKKQKDRYTYERWTCCEDCRAAQPEYRLICQRCGAEMTAKTKIRKYCDECGKTINRERATRRAAELKKTKGV